MKKDLEKRNEFIGLEEINQVETNEVNGGFMIDPIIIIVCCRDIPPMPEGPTDILRPSFPFPW